jgi:hypothetical protein
LRRITDKALKEAVEDFVDGLRLGNIPKVPNPNEVLFDAISTEGPSRQCDGSCPCGSIFSTAEETEPLDEEEEIVISVTNPTVEDIEIFLATQTERFGPKRLKAFAIKCIDMQEVKSDLNDFLLGDPFESEGLVGY